jgi:hypothetical protein
VKNKTSEINFFNSLKFSPGIYVKHAIHGLGQIDDFLENDVRLVSFVHSGYVESSIITPLDFKMFYADYTNLNYEEFLANITIHETARVSLALPINELTVTKNSI